MQGRNGTARVRRIEPAAFTKISALGVEEQRVHVLCDLSDPPAEARAHAVEVGKSDGRLTEVIAGLEAGDEVLLHPPDTVKDGTPVVKRK